MLNIEYKRELFDILNDLSPINKSIALESIDDQIVVKKSDKHRTFAYVLKCSHDYCSIDKTIAFYDYSNFYKFLSTVKNAKLSIANNNIVLCGNGVKLNYLLSDEEGIINGPKHTDLPKNADVQFTLTKENIDEIVKLNSLVKGAKARLTCVDGEVTIKFYTTNTDNSFEKTFECERPSDYDKDITFDILANRFDLLPSKRDYVVQIYNFKFIQFSLIHEDIELSLYSGESK